jgi:hypothetical protein
VLEEALRDYFENADLDGGGRDFDTGTYRTIEALRAVLSDTEGGAG